MARILALLRHIDWPLAVAALLLILLGAATIFSIGVNKTPPDFDRFWRQCIAFGIGTIAFLVLVSTDFRTWNALAWMLYAAGLALLILVLFFGQEIRGTKGWFAFEPLGIQLQPIEVMKVLFVLAFGRFLADREGQINRPRTFAYALLIIAVPVGLTILQPDLGSAVILFALWVGMLLVAHLPRRAWLVLLIAAVLVSFVGWKFLLQDYQRERILTFLNPERDPLGVGYNIRQSIIAIGSGELLGRGLGLGPQSQLNFLPEQETDFIFAVIAEELGFLGALLLLSLFALLLFRILAVARRAPDDFSAYVVVGFGVLFFIQMFVNIGTNIGLVPVAGVPLPLVSYGGTSLIASVAALGIVQSIAARRGSATPIEKGSI